MLARALENVTFTVDPHAETFETLVENGLDAGTQKKGSIDGLFDLRALNALLDEGRVPRRSQPSGSEKSDDCARGKNGVMRTCP